MMVIAAGHSTRNDKTNNEHENYRWTNHWGTSLSAFLALRVALALTAAR